MLKPNVEELFAGDSEIAALMRSHFANANVEGLGTLLGLVETWSASLNNALSILFNSCCPMFFVWDCNPTQNCTGERLLFYNDAYLSLLKETQYFIPLGRSIKDSWNEDWSNIQSDVEQVFTTGKPLRREQQPFLNHQKSDRGEPLYTWAYNAIWNETGQICGVFATGCRVFAEAAVAAITVEERCQDRQELQTSHPILQPPTVTSPLQQTEAALQESEARFQAFMRHSPMSAWIVDEEGRVLYLNPTYSQMFQFLQQDAVGKRIQDIYQEEFSQQFLENNRQVFETNQVIETVEAAPRPDGSIGSFLVYKFPIVQVTGETLLGGVAIDITEHRRIEETLRQREEELRLITNALPALIAYVDQDHYYRFNNQTYETWFGQPAASFTGKPVQEVVGDAAYQVLRPYMEQALSGQRISFENQIAYRVGGIRYIKADYVPHINSLGEVVGYFSLINDISERKQAEEALRQSEEQFRKLANAMPQIVWTTNAKGELDYVSQQWFDYTRLTLEQTQDQAQYIQVIHPDDVSKLYEQWMKAIESSSLYQTEVRIKRASDGIYRWFLTRAVPVKTEQGQVIAWYGTSTDIDDRKQTEAALHQSEERLRLAMAGAQMGTWDLDLITGRAIWSDHYFRMLGYEPIATGEASEELWSSRIHPDDLERVNQEWQQSQQEHRFYRTEYRVVRADNGQVSWLAALGDFTYNESGLAIRSIGILFDISEQKRAEYELRESEQRLQLAQQAGRIGTWEWNLLTNEVSWSDGIWTLLALEPNSITPDLESFTRFIHPEDRARTFQEVQVALAQGDDYYGEFRIVRQDGAICWLLSKGRIIRNQDGQAEGLLGINIDITDRKHAEEALRNSAERLSVALAAAKLGDWSWNAATDSVTFSEQATEMFGIPPGTPKTWTQIQNLLHPDDRERARLQVEQVIARQTDYDIEYRVIHSNGTERWIAAKGRAQYDSVGQALGMLGVVQDITHRKQAEAEREQLLAREQAARQEAEQVNRIKDEFLAVLSHELRSPLNPILGWAKLLQTRSFNEIATKRALETIERNAKLQTQLIDDLLDVSRILRGKMMLTVSPIDLVTVVDAALETVRLSAEAKGIEIQKIVAGSMGLISGDAGRLQQIVWNLLANAVKFTPNGGQIEIRLEQVGTEAQIQVRDTGKGITPEFLPYVFEYFRQEDGTTTRKFGGLGLGLAIVRYLTELHGGTVRAESPGEGLGATFTVLLPASKSRNGENPNGLETSQVEVVTSPLANLRVLVVDDETDMRELILMILEQAGATTKVTASVTEALDTLNSFKPDILISDIGMPEMDGYDLIRQVRNLSPEQGGQILAIALTAYAGEIDRQQALAAGFQQHLAKPIAPDELVKAIVTLVKPDHGVH